MSTTTEIGRDGRRAYLAQIYLCGNEETISLATLTLDRRRADATAEAFRAAADAIHAAGLDYEQVTRYRDYHGGPRRSLAEAVWFAAELDDNGEPGDPVRIGDHDAPADIRDRVDRACAAALDAYHATMRRISDEQDAEDRRTEGEEIDA